jgi:hypothetical protein
MHNSGHNLHHAFSGMKYDFNKAVYPSEIQGYKAYAYHVLYYYKIPCFVHREYFCVSYDSQNKQRLFLYQH